MKQFFLLGINPLGLIKGKAMGEKKSIFIVEDERVVLLDIQHTLLGIGYVVAGVASSGEEVLPAIEKVHPDLVLLDIVLEGKMSGIDVAEQIQQSYEIPVVFLTSYSDEATLKQAKQTGAYGYIIKPFEERELFAAIEIAFYKFNVDRILRESKRKIELLHVTARKLARMQEAEDVYQEAVNAAEAILGFTTCNLQILEDGQFVVKSSSTRSSYGEGMTPQSAEVLQAYNENEFKIISDDVHSRIFLPIAGYGVFNAQTAKAHFCDDDKRMLDLLFGHVSESLQRITLQSNLKAQAIHDPLTGLYNRYFLYQTLENQKRLSVRYGRAIAFVMIDVNGLKEVNDKLGHLMGDQLLKDVSEVLVGACRNTDIVVRSGGDEFLIILPETGEELAVIVNRIQEKEKEWNEKHVSGHYRMSFALGYSWWTPDGNESLDDSISRADEQMYRNKRSMKQEMRSDE
ncbi:MAG: diguanylate cyclase [Candidatus Cloacimonetes bacterium]|nr:diguanylate cyclase [Candidatus Cloacimonadota bacterium]